MWKWKLRKNIVKNPVSKPSATVNEKPQPLPAEIREDKIAYYRNLFRLEFRVYDEDEIEADGGIDDASYFETGSLFGLEDERVKYYYDKFASLDALDVFYDLCLEHCEAQLAVLRKNIAKYPLLTDLYAKNFVEKKQHGHKNKKLDIEKQREHYMNRLVEDQMEKVESNQQAQQKIQTQIIAIKKKQTELGIGSTNHEQNNFAMDLDKKTTLDQNNDIESEINR